MNTSHMLSIKLTSLILKLTYGTTLAPFCNTPFFIFDSYCAMSKDAYPSEKDVIPGVEIYIW